MEIRKIVQPRPLIINGGSVQSGLSCLIWTEKNMGVEVEKLPEFKFWLSIGWFYKFVFWALAYIPGYTANKYVVPFMLISLQEFQVC